MTKKFLLDMEVFSKEDADEIFRLIFDYCIKKDLGFYYTHPNEKIFIEDMVSFPSFKSKTVK